MSFVTKDKDRDFLFPLNIIVEAQKQGISPETLREMVRHSTRVTHPLGNRRYNAFLFMVEGDEVIGFGKIQDTVVLDPIAETSAKDAPAPELSVDDALGEGYACGHCNDKKKVGAFNQCQKCDGVGCKYCDRGLVPTEIDCPACSTVV